MGIQGNWKSQNNLGKEQSCKLEDLYFPTSKLVVKLQKSRQCGTGIRTHADQWSRTKSPGFINKPSIYSQLTFDKCAKKIKWGKE